MADKAAPQFKVGDRVRMARSLREGTQALVGRIGRVVEVDDIVADGVRLQVNYDVEFEPGDQRHLHAEELLPATDETEAERKRFTELLGKLVSNRPPGVSGREMMEMSLHVTKGLQAITQSPQVRPADAEAAAGAAVFLAALLALVARESM